MCARLYPDRGVVTSVRINRSESGIMVVVVNDKRHAERIKAELKKAGFSRLNQRKFTSTYLPNVIHPNEHIRAAVTGRHKETEGFFGLVEGVLVATDERVIYVDHRPGFTKMDEISYDVISGVTVTSTIFAASITLYSKVGNYTISYSKMVSAQKFADYIERHRLQLDTPAEASKDPTFELYPPMGKVEYDFLTDHQSAVLSSNDSDGHVTGATVYYMLRGSNIYILTKSASRKAAGMIHNKEVALTVTDESALRTLQLRGVAEPEIDRAVINEVIDTIVAPRDYDEGNKLPPVMRTDGDKFIVFKITPTEVDLRDYNN